MTTAVVDSPDNEQRLASWSLSTSVAERRCAREMDTVVLETTLPVGSAHPLHEDVRPKQRPGRLAARWVPDPRAEQALICIWVRTGGEALAPSLDP